MIPFRSAAIAAILLTVGLAGCATDGPAGNGGSVRALMASQVIPAQPHRDGGSDGAAFVAGYANYKQSYVVPQPQGDSAMVGGRK